MQVAHQLVRLLLLLPCTGTEIMRRVLLHQAAIVEILAYTSFLCRFLRDCGEWSALVLLDGVVALETGRFGPEECAGDGLPLTLLVTLLEKLVSAQQVLRLAELIIVVVGVSQERARGGPLPVMARASGHPGEFFISAHEVHPGDILDLVHLVANFILGVSRGAHISQRVRIAGLRTI